MRRAARKDGNQAAIVKGLRAAGASVEVLNVKGGADLLIGYKNLNYLAEVKDPSKPKADQCLTPDQVKWHAEWKGPEALGYTVAEAWTEIGVSS